jgi:hypothetical protein
MNNFSMHLWSTNNVRHKSDQSVQNDHEPA